MELLEIKVLDEILLVPYDQTSTIGSVSAAAVLEYQSFNLKKCPQKVLCTKDLRGRVLSSGLKILEHKIDPNLEVIVEDYSNSDKIIPVEIEKLYRDWQIWTLDQIKDNIQGLAYSSIPPSPDNSVLSLLLELTTCPCERIQLASIKILQILLTKFPQKQVIITAAEAISRLFVSTQHAEVALTALACYHGLSPLQFQLFDGNKYLKNMFDIQHNLMRFSKEKQSMIFNAFASLSCLLDDSDLQKVLTYSSSSQQLTDGDKQSDMLADEMKESLSMSSLAPESEHEKGDHVEANNVNLEDDDKDKLPSGAEPVTAITHKKFNLNRLLSLIASEDPKIRLYSLEKLHSKLSEGIATNDSQKSNALLLEKESVSDAVINSTAGSRKPSPSQLLTSQDDSTVMTKAPPTAVSHTKLSAVQTTTDRTNLILFTTEREVDTLIRTLFTCLKASIHSRQQPVTAAQENNANENNNTESADVKISNKSKRNVVKDNNTANQNKDKKTSGVISTAARLIQTALKSPLSDITAIRLIVNCLWLLVHYTCNIQLLSDDVYKHTSRHKMNNVPLTNIQLIFIQSAREWYRLLLTLSHADECFMEQFNLTDISEKCAYLYSLVMINGMHNNWLEAKVKIEYEALLSFINAPQRPNYRMYVALCYLLHFTQTTNQQHNVAPTDKIKQLKDIVSIDNYRLFHSLWQWAISDYANQKTSLFSMAIISELSVYADINVVFLKVEPIEKLLKLLMTATRDREKEKLNFSADYPYNSSSNVGDSRGSVMTERSYSASNKCKSSHSAGGSHPRHRHWEFSLYDDSSSDSDIDTKEKGVHNKHGAEDGESGDWADNMHSSDDDEEGHRSYHGKYGQYSHNSENDDSDDNNNDNDYVVLDKVNMKQSKSHSSKKSLHKSLSLRGVKKAHDAVPKTIIIDPDVLLIRAILKTLVNLLNSPAMVMTSSSAAVQKQQQEFIYEVVEVLSMLHITSHSMVVNGAVGSGCNQHHDDSQYSVSLKRIAKRDDVIMFYYAMLMKLKTNK